MPNNLLLIPFLAGYLFISRTFYFRYRGQLLDGYRLLFECALWGAVLTLPARLITFLLHGVSGLQGLQAEWSEFAQYPFLGTALLTVVLGYFLPLLLNRFWMNAEESKNAAVENSANPLQILMNEAINGNLPVAVTLSNRKFYVGYVTSSPIINPANRHLSILPIASGYRNPDSLKYTFTTDYLQAHQLKKLDANDLSVVIPIDTIQMANLFDPDMYSDAFSKGQRLKSDGGPEEEYLPL